EKHDRSQQVIALSDRCLDAFYARFMGQVRPVLLEHSRQAGARSVPPALQNRQDLRQDRFRFAR
ncbi:MAG: hypothetical protein IIX84_05215, partial [Oscillospiraceae bacterium]|nr:hypothetical protein [Oscillospiraceae bacterium]